MGTAARSATATFVWISGHNLRRAGPDALDSASGKGDDRNEESSLFLPSPWKSQMTQGNRRLDIEEVNGVTIARFTDKKILDESNIQIIGNQLFSLVDEDHRQKIILDFTNVEYLSSAALGKLITMDKKVKAAGGKLRLCSIRSDIKEVFKITRLDKLFQILDNRDKAVEGF
jgi:anti-sigma B factor antagonist